MDNLNALIHLCVIVYQHFIRRGYDEVLATSMTKKLISTLYNNKEDN